MGGNAGSGGAAGTGASGTAGNAGANPSNLSAVGGGLDLEGGKVTMVNDTVANNAVDSSGNLMSVTLFAFNVTFLFV